MARPTSTNNSDNPRTTPGAGRPSTHGATRTGSEGRASGSSYTPPSYHDVTLDNVFENYQGTIADNIFQNILGNTILPSDKIQYFQLLLQYLMSEQNYQRQLGYNELSYERSRAYNQVAELMNAGMSRAAALQALQGGSTPQAAAETQGITPYQPQFNPLDLFNTIIGGVGSLANIGTSLATLPATLTAKQLTNKLLSHQGALLGSQVQGLNDAALFMQAVANAPEDVQKMKLYDQINYFKHQASLSEKVPEYNFAAAAFGRTAEFVRSLSNPFFYSAVNSSQKDTNLNFASLFEPERMQATISHMRACQELATSNKEVQDIHKHLLQNEEYMSDITLQARADVEQLRLECENKGFQFDNERAKKFLERVQSYTYQDYLALQFQLQRLKAQTSPEAFEAYRDELITSMEYNACMYHYQYSLTNAKWNVWNSKYEDEGGMPVGAAEKWLDDYFRFQEFGGAASTNAAQGWWRTAFSGITAGAAMSFAGAKLVSLFQGSKAAAAAAATAASSAASSAPPTPFNIFAPVVVPSTQKMLWDMKGLSPEQLYL